VEKRYTQVQFGTHEVPVLEGGYYDRFRMNPDLDEVARDPAAGNVDFFRRFPKQQVTSRVGPTWAPNFYYRTSNVQLLMQAPLTRLRAMLPEPLEPLSTLPGFGLVALSFFSYSVCDNDPYDEASIAIVIRRPGAKASFASQLWTSMRRRSFFAHVLALPVTTEIARTRGVEGYQLPKWREDMDLSIDADVRANIAGPDGSPDLSLRAPLPAFRQVVPQSRMSTTIMVHQVNGAWHQTLVHTNTLSFAQMLLPRNVELIRAGGPMSQLLDGLGASRFLRFDVVKDAQVVLNLPTLLRAVDAK
jgi:hypothetical protein